jgi:hypothetical protein
MIQAKELRIGNWVIYEGVPYQIEDIKVDAYTGHLHPIPLTPEILEKSRMLNIITSINFKTYTSPSREPN